MPLAVTVVNDIENCFPKIPDIFFITCASFEERCLGVPQKLSKGFQFEKGCVFVYDDPNKKRERNLEKLETTLISRGHFTKISTSENDPLPAIGKLYNELKNVKQRDFAKSAITLDISTFTKRHLLLLLKAIDDLGLWKNLRIFYTEPREYIADLYLPMSRGIRTISPISGFISNSPPNLPVLLIIFLGYEGDRARAIYENLDPEDTILIVPKPAYHKEWENRTEKMNQSLIRMVEREKIENAHSINPIDVANHLQKVLKRFNPNKWRWIIVPLGTKPQALGTYLFWRQHPNAFSIVYAQPLKHNERFFSTGIGKTWLLKDREK